MLYFAKDASQERYNLDFSLRKVLNGRWVYYGFFDSHHFELSKKMDNLGWKSMTTMREEVYPYLVRHFYANATRKYQDEPINSYVQGEPISLDRSMTREILGIGYSGEIYRSKITQKRQLDVLYGQNVEECVQPIAKDLKLEIRLVHHFVCTTFISRTEKYEYVTSKELFFLWAYMTDTRIDLPTFILDQI